MAKKRSKKQSQSNNGSAGCVWGLIRMLYFRRDAKYLLDPHKQGGGNKKNSTKGSSKKNQRRLEETDLQIADEDDEKAALDSAMVKNLIDKELTKLRSSSKRKIPTDEVDRLLSELSGDIRAEKSFRENNPGAQDSADNSGNANLRSALSSWFDRFGCPNNVADSLKSAICSEIAEEFRSDELAEAMEMLSSRKELFLRLLRKGNSEHAEHSDWCTSELSAPDRADGGKSSNGTVSSRLGLFWKRNHKAELGQEIREVRAREQTGSTSRIVVLKPSLEPDKCDQCHRRPAPHALSGMRKFWLVGNGGDSNSRKERKSDITEIACQSDYGINEKPEHGPERPEMTDGLAQQPDGTEEEALLTPSVRIDEEDEIVVMLEAEDITENIHECVAEVVEEMPPLPEMVEPPASLPSSGLSGSADCLIQKPESPSPVSVLDSALLPSEFESPEPTMTIECNCDKLCIESRSDDIMQDKNMVLRYMKSVLQASGLCIGENEETWQSDYTLNAAMDDVADKKLLFDCIEEEVSKIQETYFGRFLQHRLSPVSEAIVREVFKGIERHSNDELPHTLEGLIGRNVQEGPWIEAKLEVEPIVLDVWDYVLTDLVDEIVIELWL